MQNCLLGAILLSLALGMDAFVTVPLHTPTHCHTVVKSDVRICRVERLSLRMAAEGEGRNSRRDALGLGLTLMSLLAPLPASADSTGKFTSKRTGEL